MQDQRTFLSDLSKRNKDAVIISSLGSLSTDLGLVCHKNCIFVKGAMGCAIGVGLGYALGSKKKVIVVIGDGSTLMKMGSIATYLQYKPKNLSIYIINNGKYHSCGDQPTTFNKIRKYIPKSINEIICK